MRRPFVKLVPRIVLAPVLAMVSAGFCGCTTAKHHATYQTTLQSLSDRSELAVKANGRGLQFIEQGDYQQAEEAFREALKSNISYAPAHNNLGLVLTKRGKVYEAALEYAFASKLQPHATEPLINLGRLYESVSWEKAAVDEYERALALAPTNTEALGRLAQLYSKSGANPKRLDPILQVLASLVHSPRLAIWAQNQLLVSRPCFDAENRSISVIPCGRLKMVD